MTLTGSCSLPKDSSHVATLPAYPCCLCLPPAPPPAVTVPPMAATLTAFPTRSKTINYNREIPGLKAACTGQTCCLSMPQKLPSTVMPTPLVTMLTGFAACRDVIRMPIFQKGLMLSRQRADLHILRLTRDYLFTRRLMHLFWPR